MSLSVFRTLTLTAGLLLAATQSARADFELTFQGTSPSTDLQFSAGSHFFGVMPTGTMNFQTGAGAAAEGFGPTVRGYCVDLFREVAHPGPASYAVVPLTSIPDIAHPPLGTTEPATKAAYLTELWGRYAASATTNTTAAAFALAVWKLLYDPVSDRTNFATANIRFGGEAAANPVVGTASGWLASLSGDTSYFTSNPLYAGAELVGLESPTYQNQIAVRDPGTPVVPAPAGVVLAALGSLLLAARSRLGRRA